MPELKEGTKPMEHAQIEAANDAALPAIIVLERANLAEALTFLCGSIIERRNPIPILSGVLFAPEGNGSSVVTITGTDLDIFATTSLPGDWPADCEPFVAADAKALLSAVKGCGDELVTLELTEGGKLKVSGGGASMLLPTLPADRFPHVAPGVMLASLAFPADEFALDLARVQPAISTEETRYYLNGIFMHRYGGDSPMLRFAATDGHRLHVVTRAMPEGVDAETFPDVIVPRKSIAAMLKLIGKPKKKATSSREAKFSVSDTKSLFCFDRWRVTAKLIDGSFPDYTRVIPTANDKVMTIAAKALDGGIASAAAVVAKEGTRAVHMAITGAGLTLSCYSPESGVAEATVACGWKVPGTYDEAAPPSLEIGANAAYARELCGIFGEGDVNVTIADCTAPMLWTSRDMPDFLGVLMPMHTDAGRSIAAAQKDAEPEKPSESPYHRFQRLYAEAYAARDKAAIAEAVRDRMESLAESNPKSSARENRQELVLKAANIRREAEQKPKAMRDLGKQLNRARLRQLAMAAEAHGFHCYGHGRTHNSAGFGAIRTMELAIAQLATMPGFDPADSRHVLPIVNTVGEEAFVLASELRDLSKPFLQRVSATGKEQRSRRHSNCVYRTSIVSVTPPKVSGTMAARQIADLQDTVVAMLRRIDTLEAELVELRARPVESPAVAVSGPVLEPEAPSEAPPAQPGPETAPEPVADALADAINAVAAIASDERAELVSEIDRLSAALRVSEASRARLSAKRLGTCTRIRALRHRARDNDTRATDALNLAQQSAERAVDLTRRLTTSQAEVARLAPIAAAIEAVRPVQVQPLPTIIMGGPAVRRAMAG
jgi:DNA polymerase-3 subunit beta